MKYQVNEAVFEEIIFPYEKQRKAFQTKYNGLIENIGHVLDKNMTDFLFTSYVYMLKALSNGDNRIATKQEHENIQEFCRNYVNTYDNKDNLLYDMAFNVNKYHKEQWDGYLSDGRMKQIIKSEHSLKPRVMTSIDLSDILDSVPIKFAYDVVNDKSECYWIRLQAKKFIEDFTINQFKEDFPYYFNPEILRIVEVFLRQVNLATAMDTKLIGDSIANHIKPFQYFMLANVWAWRKKEDIAQNRYQRFVLFIPRKNAKSWLVSAVKLLGLILLPNNSELYSASNTREQANQIRKELENITNASPAIKRYFKINRDEVLALHSNTKFKVLSGKPKDGSLPSIAAIDENGDAIAENPVASSLVNGLAGAFKLAFYVSTAYAKYPSGMSVEVEIAKNSLNPDSKYLDEGLFAMLYTAQEPNLDWTSEEALKATNPLMWETNREFLLNQQSVAIEQRDTKENEFKTKHLNIFLATNVGSSIAPIENLEACYNFKPNFDWFGKKCVLGLDLSMGDDNSALSLITNHEGKYYLKQWIFVPKGRLAQKEKLEKINYGNWIATKQVIITEDPSSNNVITNYNTIENFILELPRKLGVEITHIAYDVYGSHTLVQNLQIHDSMRSTEFQMIKQSKAGRHFGIQLLRTIVLQNRLSFDNSMMKYEWGAVQMGQTDNLYFVSKVETAINKTDMVYSLINALDVCNELYEVNQPKFTEDLFIEL